MASVYSMPKRPARYGLLKPAGFNFDELENPFVKGHKKGMNAEWR